MIEHHIVPGARHLKPVLQGTLSRLCGVYSVLNAIQLCLYPERLNGAEMQRLYRHAIHYLSRRKQLSRVIGVGMAYQLWMEATAELIAYVNAAYDTEITASRILKGSAATDRQRAIRQIKKSLRRGRPVVALLGGTLNHYSVFCGYTASRLLLFDSSGLSWVRADNVGLGEHSRRTHWLLAEYTSSIAEHW